MDEVQPACQKITNSNGGLRCQICLTFKTDPIKYGEFYECEGIICHYFCLLFSAKLIQNGEDHEGILGFFPKDIRQEIRRGRRLKCVFCRKSGATIGCDVKSCKKTFHLPCGIEKGTLHQFFGRFSSFCGSHRPQQVVPKDYLNYKNDPTCPICYDNVEAKVCDSSLWAPCCKKRWFHRPCVQKLAVSSGYFFKCPLCNNKERFSEEMQRLGIYIPEMDAAWELVPGAYNDLLQMHATCDASECQCPDGRNFSSNVGGWRLLRCNACGAQGVHIACAFLKVNVASNAWRCAECDTVLNRVEKPVLQASTLASTSASTSMPLPHPLKRRRVSDQSEEEKENQDNSDEKEDAVIVDDSDSDVEILEVLETVPKRPVSGVGKELLTNEGKTIKVHKLEALGKIPSELGQLGVVKVIKPSQSTSSSQPTTSSPVVSSSSERFKLKLGSQISLFPVPSTSSPPAPKIPTLRDVMITPVPSSVKPPITEFKERHKPIVQHQATSRINSSFENQSAQDSVSMSSSSSLRISDVRHSTELFQGMSQVPAGQPIIPVMYYPITTNDGRTAIQAMIPLPLNIQQPLTLQQLLQPPAASQPDVVTLD